LGDHNTNHQTHDLIASDSTGAVVDKASFTEPIGEFPHSFALTVSSCKGIAFVLAIEQQFGAERLERIILREGTRNK
jgi:hypothetical protein